MNSLYLAVKRPNMTHYAQHTQPKPLSEQDFLNLPEIQQIIKSGKQFGDKIRLMEDNPDPLAPNRVIKEL
jgi:hypothetical protein